MLTEIIFSLLLSKDKLKYGIVKFNLRIFDYFKIFHNYKKILSNICLFI
jgi:hypothetical protein